MKTTLNKIRSHGPCKDGWETLLAHLDKTKADDEPLHLLTILESNGVGDALWCLPAVDGHEKEKRLLAVAFARRVQHLMTDQRSIAALDVAERYAHGHATDAEMEAAKLAAYAAVDAAAVRDAAYASAAVRAAAYAAYASSAVRASRNVAWAAAWEAEAADDHDAERAAQAQILREMLG